MAAMVGAIRVWARHAMREFRPLGHGVKGGPVRTRSTLVAVVAMTTGLVGMGAAPAAAGVDAPAGAPTARTYRTVDLGTFGGVESQATAINAAGQVVGFSETRSGHRRAFLWSRGRMIDLGTLGGAQASAADINAAGQVVGASDTANGESHAFLWSRGRMTDLGTLGGPSSAAAAINDAGTVVGAVTVTPRNSNDNGKRAFQWRAGRMTLLAGLPGSGVPGSSFHDGTAATDINLDGDVVGVGKGSSALVRWHQGVPRIVFETASFLFIDNPRINRPGDVLASFFETHLGVTLYFPVGSTERVLHPLGVRSFADTASAINDSHQFVGGYASSASTAFSESLPYLSAGDFSLLDLTTRGLATTARLTDINNSGQLVGSVVVGAATHPALFLP